MLCIEFWKNEDGKGSLDCCRRSERLRRRRVTRSGDGWTVGVVCVHAWVELCDYAVLIKVYCTPSMHSDNKEVRLAAASSLVVKSTKNAGFWPTVFCLVARRSYKAKQLQSPARKNGKKMLVNFGRIWNCSVQHVPTRQNKMKQHKKQQSSDKITIQMRLGYQQLFSALPLTGELVNPADCYS